MKALFARILCLGLFLTALSMPQRASGDELIDEAEAQFGSHKISRQASEKRIKLPSESSHLFYVAPWLGTTSFTNPAGGDRGASFSYGFESVAFLNEWGLGLHVVSLNVSNGGTQQISVSNDLLWATAEVKYRYAIDFLSPYLTAGAGPAYESVTTSLKGQSEKNTAWNFLTDIGLGVLGQISGNWSADLSIKYFQYSNVNGFNYLFSVGYSAPSLF